MKLYSLLSGVFLEFFSYIFWESLILLLLCTDTNGPNKKPEKTYLEPTLQQLLHVCFIN